jgi:diguanylate cyclase (GGDEF)-like protein
MKTNFYKYAPAVLAIIGFIFSTCIYSIAKFLPSGTSLVLWGALTLSQTFSGLMLGLAIKRLHNRSNSDALTGLQNKRYFYNRLAYEMGRLKRVKLPVSIALIDVDDFKSINDTYGHVEGDRVLLELANIFKAYARAKDTVTVWGGDEYAVILPDTDIKGAEAFAERIRSEVEKHNFPYKVTISVGITCTIREDDMEKLMAVADKALYKAKETKNNVVSIVGSLCVELI